MNGGPIVQCGPRYVFSSNVFPFGSYLWQCVGNTFCGIRLVCHITELHWSIDLGCAWERRLHSIGRAWDDFLRSLWKTNWRASKWLWTAGGCRERTLRLSKTILIDFRQSSFFWVSGLAFRLWHIEPSTEWSLKTNRDASLVFVVVWGLAPFWGVS